MSELEWMDIFGDNLATLLKEHRMTQKDLAEVIGVSEATISSYIRKKKMPGIKALINMAEVFRCTLDELMFFGDSIHD